MIESEKILLKRMLFVAWLVFGYGVVLVVCVVVCKHEEGLGHILRVMLLAFASAYALAIARCVVSGKGMLLRTPEGWAMLVIQGALIAVPAGVSFIVGWERPG